MNAVLAASLSRGRTVLSVLALVLITGTISYLTIPKESNPDIPIPIAYVSMHHEGISPEDAERMLVRPMETELRGLDGLEELTATAYQGGANIILEFQAGMDIDPVMVDVREKVDIAKAELPDETDEPTVSEVNLALQPVIVVSLSGDMPERQLQRLAQELQDDLESISEVLEVELGGDREEVVELVIDPKILETYELSLSEMSSIAARNNLLVAAGDLDSGAGRIAVKVPGLFETPEDILELPIKVVGDTVLKVSDIATVRPTFKDPTGFSRLDGRPAMSLFIKKRVGENVISAIDKVKAQVAAAQANWPAGVEVAFSQDQSRDIRNMLRDLENNVIAAIALVFIVCVAALGLRGGLLVCVAIPGSFLAGMIILSALGLTVNIVVLFSLILAVGMLVDGAIVVTELADRKMAEGEPKHRAYLIASQRMAWPIIASTATTLAAFLPLLFWPGIVGEFMKYLPITLIATLSASLLMALVFVPTIGALIGKPGAVDAETMKRLSGETGDVFATPGFTGRYVRFLAGAVRHPLKYLAATIGLFVGVQVLYGTFGKGVEFFPDVDPEYASIIVRMRGNLSVEEMDAKARAVEERILPVDGIASMTGRTGLSLSGDGITEDTHGLIQLELKDWEERRTGREILREIEWRTVGLAGVNLEALPTRSGADLSVAVDAVVPLAAGAIQERLRGLVDRLRLVREFDEDDGLEVVDGTRAIASPGSVIGELQIFDLQRPELDPPETWRERFQAVVQDAMWFLQLGYNPYASAENWARSRREHVERVVSEFEYLPPNQRNQFIHFRRMFGMVEEDRVTLRWLDEEKTHLQVVRTGQDALADNYQVLEYLSESLAAGEPIASVEKITGTRLEGAPARIGELHVTFAAGETRPADFAAVWAEWEPFVVGIPGVIVEQQAIEAGPPTGKDIQVELTSNNPEVLERAVAFVRAQMDATPGLKDVADTRPVPGVEWQVQVDRAAASRYGADISLVGSYVQFVTNGLLMGTYRPDGVDDEVDIRARFPDRQRALGQLDELRVVTQAGLVPIAHFVERFPAPKVGLIERIDGKRVYTVTANVRDGFNTTDKANEFKVWLDELDLPEGLGVRLRGQDEEQAEAMAFLMNAFGVAIFIMAIILVTQFNSFYHAFLVLTAVVFSTIGVFLGLIITGYSFGIVMNGIGVIALAGIVVNNNIVLIDTYALHRKNGQPPLEAVLRTGAQRLRPVMLTMVTTSLGLLPMVLKMNIDFVNPAITFNAPSTQWWVQLSTSVSFGLLFATMLTLILTPCLLILGERFDGQKLPPREATASV